MERVSRTYLYSTIAFMFVLPIGSIAVSFALRQESDFWSLLGTWFVFWSIGARLFAAGLKQSLQPAFTAAQIFGIKNRESHVVVRELGFANICLGLVGVLSLFIPSWRTAVAFGGGLYFGIAGMLHIVRRPATRNEQPALVTDLYPFVVIAAYLIHGVIAR